VRFLEEIVEEVRTAVSRPEYDEGVPERGPAHRPRFRDALLARPGGGGLIVEFKRRSPGSEQPDLPVTDPETFVRRTDLPSVVAYSCLATSPRFAGSPADVHAVCRSTRRPVLFKDFVVDPRQIEVAARTGASAILLIARLSTEGLLSTSLETLAEGAHRAGLEVVLEWHAPGEVRSTRDVPADVYGVNVRDLGSLAFDRPVARRTLDEASSFRPLVGMSGVSSAEDARWFWSAGVDALLVGTSVARATDPPRFLEGLLPRSEPGPA
jgi:indole-3-glycerol phosphate synthase